MQTTQVTVGFLFSCSIQPPNIYGDCLWPGAAGEGRRQVAVISGRGRRASQGVAGPHRWCGAVAKHFLGWPGLKSLCHRGSALGFGARPLQSLSFFSQSVNWS